MNEFRYILDKGNKKHYCPECNKKTFVHYIDTITGDYLPDQFGRCDRESKCTYHLNPYLTDYSKMIWEQEHGNRSEFTDNWKPQHKEQRPTPKAEPVFFDFETFKKTLKPERYEQNTFIQNLLHRVQFPFDAKEIEKIIALYYLGTIASGYRAGANTFPFIDIKGNVRTIQVKQFNNENHTTGTDFLHSIIEKRHTRNNIPLPEWLEAYLKQDKRVSCLFGSHLLSKYPQNPVALVEAPKTAIYGTLYFGFPEQPENLIWLAVYNKSSFSYDKLKVLQGRDVYTFPDLSKDGNTFKEWETKAKEMENRLPGTKFIFSDLLEQFAHERDKSKGNDLADYLIKQDWRLFRKHIIREQPKPKPLPVKILALKNPEPFKEIFFFNVESLPKVEVFNLNEMDNYKNEQSENWSKDITELATYFSNFVLPTQPLKLNQYSTITDITLFIESHLATVKNNNGNRTFLPYLNRLKELKKVLTINSN
tara:strand:+ start:5126 stop:6559 length:1434 start_codon:yes stop_codon:yes gene_type:complete